MRRYPLYNLDDKEFQGLVALICNKILGTAAIVFSDGPDGGRDAYFKGTANHFPSETTSWNGNFIIQAKHTTKPIASCSDSDFQEILKKEMPKIQKLKGDGKLDYYILFTNRKLSGGQFGKIQDFIQSKIDIDNYIIGDEKIQQWLKEYPNVVKTAKLNQLLLPLDFYENDLRDIILSFSETDFSNKNLKEITENFQKLPIEEKNKLNELSKEYFDNSLKKSYEDFQKIDDFLKNPVNIPLVNKYRNSISDINSQILVHRDEYGKFEEIIEYIFQILLDENNSKLMKNRRLIRIFLHYMYANCDIGRTE